MKLQWDKNYLKIAFYVVLTLVSTYILFKVVDSAAYVLTNAGEIGGDINRGIGYVFSVFSVLIIGFVIAYLLDPLVDFFQRRYDRLYDKEIQPLIHRRFQPMLRFRATLKAAKTRRVFKKRTAGTVLTYLIFFSAIGLLIFFIVSRIHIGGTTSADIPRDLISSVNKTANEFGDFVAGTQLTLENWGVSDEVADMVSNLFSAATDFVKGFSENIGPTLTSATTGTVDFFMGLVVAFYFLMDKEMIAARSTELCDTFLPKKIGRRVKNILGDVHVVFSGYIRGQMTDAAIIGVLLSFGLSLVGVNFAVLIGMFSGLANLIPYFGAFVGFILSVFVALLSGDVTQAVYAGIIVIVLQQIDGIFIQPKIVGEKVELSPVLVLLSLSVFGSMFGLPGMIFAVPLCAIFKIFLTRFMTRYKKSKLEKERELKFNQPD